MQAGKLNSTIDILQPDATSNAYGEPILQYATFIPFNIWAQVEPLSGDELYKAEQVQSVVDTRFTIRYTTVATITPAHIVLYNGEQYNIKSVINVNADNRMLVLNCNRVAT